MTKDEVIKAWAAVSPKIRKGIVADLRLTQRKAFYEASTMEWSDGYAAAIELLEGVIEDTPTRNHKSCPSHCCKEHGCKYGFDDCPVVGGTAVQEYPCENCRLEDGVR